MLNIRHYSIKTKLTLMNMLISGVTLLLACTAFGAYDLTMLRASIVRSKSIQAQIVGANSASALLFNDSKSAQNTLSALKAAPMTMSCGIYTLAGEPLAMYWRVAAGYTLPLPLMPEGQTEAYWFVDKELRLIRSIVFQGKQIGTVYIRSDLQELNDRLALYAGAVAIVLSLSLLAAFLLSTMLQRAAIQPILKLAETARIVSRKKEYSVRVPTTDNHDEVGLLIESFNEMLAQIQERDAALQTSQEQLEQRVVQRTAELDTTNKELESANRAKSTFLSTMSHEIRTPMNAILGYAQLMLRDPGLGKDAKANLKIIGRSGEHLLALINEVLDMSKIEAGRMELKPATFSLSRLLEDLSIMFRLRAEAKALQFEMLVDGESAPYVVADEGKLRQAVINLIGNAIKFTAHGQIKLHVTLDQRSANQLWLAARVEDTGSGISDEEKGKLFEPFSQTRRGLQSQEGTGLGLAISRKFARLMGGDLTVTSIPGKGSIFQFEVPIERGDAGVAIRRSAPRRVTGIRAGTEVPRILVVDDLLENRDWLMKLLTSIGFPVRDADNGEAAIRNWEEWKPRLILMDVHMPVMDGRKATREIKADPRGKETVIVALTASAMDDDRLAVFQCGADDFITKPCREDELLEKIRLHLHIDYDYEEMSGDEGEPVFELAALSADGFGRLPRELVEELRDATLSGNKKLLDKLILQVSETDQAEFASSLQALADRYEYDALTRLLEEACRR